MIALQAHAIPFDVEQVQRRSDFVPFREGVEIAWLFAEREPGAASAFLRYAPKARVPRHRHDRFEHILVLSGSQSDERGRYPAGTLIISAPGTEHSVWSDEGCLVLAIWPSRVTFLSDSASRFEP